MNRIGSFPNKLLKSILVAGVVTCFMALAIFLFMLFWTGFDVKAMVPSLLPVAGGLLLYYPVQVLLLLFDYI